MLDIILINFERLGPTRQLNIIDLFLYGTENEFLIAKSTVSSIEILDEWLIRITHIIANFVLGLDPIISPICHSKLWL